MTAFDWTASGIRIRDDLRDAYRAAWAHIAKPGTWLSGDERVAVAEETRRARSCRLCAERRAALSPFSADLGPNGEPPSHDDAGVLPAPLVDEIHRITTDAARLTRSWVESLIEDGLTYEEYVEALGVTVITISIDRFHHALDLPLERLPTPEAGVPTRKKVEAPPPDEAWVPIQSAQQTSKAIGLPGVPAPNVLRALSLVPAEVRAWQALAAAQYLDEKAMMRFDSPRTANRSQIELVAGRVSALNECFY